MRNIAERVEPGSASSDASSPPPLPPGAWRCPGWHSAWHRQLYFHFTSGTSISMRRKRVTCLIPQVRKPRLRNRFLNVTQSTQPPAGVNAGPSGLRHSRSKDSRWVGAEDGRRSAGWGMALCQAECGRSWHPLQWTLAQDWRFLHPRNINRKS